MAKSAVLIDGGLSNALEERGHDLSGPLWTAQVLRDAPEGVEAVHRAYLEAGAEVVTSASYQTAEPELLRRSVAVACRARDAVGHGWVAASVGPYGAVLADGSEYRGRYGVPAAALRDFHGPRLEVLSGAGADFLAVETIPDVDEAEVLARLVHELGMAAWFSYSVAGLRTRADQALADAFAVPGEVPSVFAVGVNCCAPADVLPAVRLAVQVTGKPAVAYPNSGESWDAVTRSWTGARGYDVRLARDWVAAGAEWVGGCCRVGPSDIAALAAAI
jgi:homocysteine S-methyltransferase